MGETDEEIIRNTTIGNISFPIEDWNIISSEVIDLIKKMTDKNSDKRITAQDAI
jgi:hypothetical protein